MTILIAGLSVVLTVAFAWFNASMAGTVAERAGAQYAADAAALAAAGAMVPGDPANPQEEARRFAEANGAKFVACECDIASGTAVVTVAIGGTEAKARAALDATLLAPRSLGASSAGLHPSLSAAVATLLEESRGAIVLNSGWRSPQRQTELWQDALRRYGSAEAADDWVAPPGHSMHETGLAVDLGGDLDLARRLIASLGLPLHTPLAHEPWHFELLGSR